MVFAGEIAADLEADGASTDFHVRDAMHYHLTSMKPLLTLARAGERHGEHLFDYRGQNGASLHNAVDFVVPFADGSKTHMEFVNSKSNFDRERANNGEKEYQPHSWDPESFNRNAGQSFVVSSRVTANSPQNLRVNPTKTSSTGTWSSTPCLIRIAQTRNKHSNRTSP